MARTAPFPKIPAIPGMNPSVLLLGGGGGNGRGDGRGGSGKNGGNRPRGGCKDAASCGPGVRNRSPRRGSGVTENERSTTG